MYCTLNYSLDELFESQILLALKDRFDVYDCTGVDVKVTKRRSSFPPQRVLRALMTHDNEFPVASGTVDEVDSHSVTSFEDVQAFGSEAEALLWTEEDFPSPKKKTCPNTSRPSTSRG